MNVDSLATGPTSAEGKAVVAKNAIKHGIFAKEFIIDSGDGQENPAEYHRLLQGLQDDLKPVGQMEQLLVEKIAVNWWRLRRVLRYETGETQRQLCGCKEDAMFFAFQQNQDAKAEDIQPFYDFEHRVRSLPSEEALNKISRYDTALERSNARNLTMLKALQEERRRINALASGFVSIRGRA